MFEVCANSITCNFVKEEDAINAFVMAIGMIENVSDLTSFESDIEYALKNNKDNLYEFNYYMSIRQLNDSLGKE